MSELAVLPNEWRLTKLREVAYYQEGPGVRTWQFKTAGIKLVNVSNLVGDRLDLSNTNRFLNESETESKYSHFLLDAGDIVLASSGASWGKIALVEPHDLPLCLNTSVIRVRPLKEAALSFHYLWHFLSSLVFKEQIEKLITGSAQPNFGSSHLNRILLPLPPLPEQIEIARILSLWDDAIRDTTKLIAAKTRLKRALMQQLLTGKRRFREFEGQEWKTYRLGDLFHERGESNRPDLPLLSIAADRGIIPRGEIDRKDSSNEDKKAYLRIAPGDIGYNTMRMWQGVSAVSRLEGLVSPAYTICVPNELIEADYAGYLFKFAPMVALFHRHSQGMVSDTLNLKFSNFSRIKVCIPAREEQQKIVAVFQTFDSEIQLLQTQLAALKQQKKGLMQKLLTGQVRVEVPS